MDITCMCVLKNCIYTVIAGRIMMCLSFITFVVVLLLLSLLSFYVVKLLLSDQLRDHQKVFTEEKGSPSATKVHHIKLSDNIYFNNTLLLTKSYVVGTHLNGLIEMIQMSTNNIGFS